MLIPAVVLWQNVPRQDGDQPPNMVTEKGWPVGRQGIITKWRPTNQSVKMTINKPTNQQRWRSTSQDGDQSTNQPIGRNGDQPTNMASKKIDHLINL